MADTATKTIAAESGVVPEATPGSRHDLFAMPVRAFVVTLGAAYVGNLAIQQPAANTLAMSLFILLSAIAVWVAGYARTKASLAMLVGAVGFGGFLTWRTEIRLVVFDLLAALLLLIGAAAFGRDDSVWDLPPLRLGLELLDLVGSWLLIPIDLVAGKVRFSGRTKVQYLANSDASEGGLEESTPRTWTPAGVTRGVLLALPIVVLLGQLLAAADPVFASLFSFDTGLIEASITHGALTVLVSSLILGLQRKSSRDAPSVPDLGVRLSIGASEAKIVLGSVNLLFALFAASQLYALSGAATRILDEADLTAKDYARQGFFQLLWVAGLTVVLIIGIWALRSEPAVPAEGSDKPSEADDPDQAGPAAKVDQADRAGQRAKSDMLLKLSYLSFVLTMGIVAVAVVRLRLYIQDTGLTPLRFYSTVFSVWIGMAFAIVLARVSGLRPGTSWLTPALILSGLATLFVLNLVNPESIIANYNLDRHSPESWSHISANRSAQYYERFDVLMAHRMSNDGRLVLIEGIDSVPEELRANVESAICDHLEQGEQDRGWLSFNFAESKYEAAERELCR